MRYGPWAQYGVRIRQTIEWLRRSRYHVVWHHLQFVIPRSSSEEAAPTKSVAEPVTGGSEFILVVDDEEDMADFATRTLESYGYSVISVSNIESAKQHLASNNSVDLIFSDVVMPNGSGFDLATYVESERLPVKVLLTSGYADTKDRALEFSALTENMLQKPYDRDALLRKVRATLDG
ncbi:MAG: response regulator [Gammaproteobacteria bacterium]|nr:response regulator [Gammaproteobacteria bacterium]